MIPIFRLVDNNLSDCFLLSHAYFLFFAVLQCAVVAITHHDVEVCPVLMVYNTYNLVVVAYFILRRMLVILDSFNKLRSHVRGQSFKQLLNARRSRLNNHRSDLLLLNDGNIDLRCDLLLRYS